MTFRLRPKFMRPPLLLHMFSIRTVSTTAATRMAKFDEEVLGQDKHGYYPVSAGTIIGDDGSERYEAVRKLGWGVNSTVWLGRNCSDEAVPKYVALKILNRSATREHESVNSSELQMLLRTQMGKEPEHRPQTPSYEEQGLDGPSHPGWYRVSGCLGAFYFNNSQHLVIVSPLYGQHMKDYMNGEPNGRLTPAFVKQIARHTLLALDYLHSQCGIIHSDVKPENLLRDFNLGPQIDDIIETLLKKEPDAGHNGRSAPLWIPHADRPDDLDIVLADLSHASWNDLILRSPRNVGSPALKAPELIMGFAFTTAIDIWAFGCTVSISSSCFSQALPRFITENVDIRTSGG
ncbi:hypothetical protein AX16_010955 [Volvariella volvacea WC 439]|nr:hypothetical protein AX16_010955 [Volvariella volvacea WC 439]